MASDRSSISVHEQAKGGISRRHILAGSAGLAATALLPPTSSAANFPVPEIPPLMKTDYALERTKFRTKLVRLGPSPEKSSPLGTPAHARTVMYPGGPDGSIPLIAWVTPFEPSSTLRPAVVFLHGGNATGDGHWELMKGYWEAGFAVIHPSFRGENGQAGNYSGFYDENTDALAAASYLENMPGIDKNRIFVAGHSNGGTLSILASMSRKFRAATPISGGVNGWRYFDRFEAVTPFDETDEREFIMRSSACFAGSIKCPMLMLRGTEERPFGEDHFLLMDRARAAGVKIDTQLVPGNHHSSVPGAVLESVRFFNQFT